VTRRRRRPGEQPEVRGEFGFTSAKERNREFTHAHTHTHTHRRTHRGGYVRDGKFGVQLICLLKERQSLGLVWPGCQ
jgi:hypothetical protein